MHLLYNGENGILNLEERFKKINEQITQDKITSIILKNRHTTRRSIYYFNEISNGLFFISSFFNHSCDCNIFYEGIGDFIFCFAIKDIYEGDELTLLYVAPRLNYHERREKLNNWNIECDCNLCKHDLETMNKEYKIKYNEFIDFFNNYKYKANINEENLKMVFNKITELSSFIVINKNKLTSYEMCNCLLHIFNFYAFISNMEGVKIIKEQFFNIENSNHFDLGIELLNSNLRFNRHLIDVNYKDNEKIYNETINELIKYFKKLTPYKEDSIKEMLNSNIKQYKIDFTK